MDSKGRAIEPGRRYVVELNSQAQRMDAIRIGGETKLMDGDRRHYDIDHLMEAGFNIYRYCDWIELQGRARLQTALEDAAERAESCRNTLAQLEREVSEMLFAGSNSDSADLIMGFIYDGRGTVEDLLTKIPVHGGSPAC